MKCIFGGEFVLNGKIIAVPIIIAGGKRKIFPGAARFARKAREFNSVQPMDLTVLEGKGNPAKFESEARLV